MWEDRPKITSSQHTELLERNRELYSEPPVIPEQASFPERKQPKSPPQPTKREEPVSDEQPQSFDVPAESEKQDTPEEAVKTVTQPKKEKQTPPKDIPQSGRGGRQHKYLQQLIKQLAEERGFRATIEETILDGAGRVDVSLVCDEIRVACQVSVTTTKDWELGGIEKCFAAGLYRSGAYWGDRAAYQKTSQVCGRKS